jgi:hypothetical protein
MGRAVPLPGKFIDAPTRVLVHKALERYISATPLPQLAEFIANDSVPLKYKVLVKNINDWREFDNTLKLMDTKAEAYLVKQGMYGVSPTMVKFLLTQPKFGYRDKSDVDLTSGGEKITFMNSVPRPRTDATIAKIKKLAK